jgi:uncharacterized protein (TIGR03435 family)
MLQNLLAKRFLLAADWDRRPYPEYLPRVGKTNPQIKPVPLGTTGEPKYSMKFVNGHVQLNLIDKPLSALGGVLTAFLTAHVLDETGRTEAYSFTLDFMPDDRWRGFEYLPKSAAPGDPDVPSLELALKDQLGLTLDKHDSPLRVLVVDRVERVPTEN